MAEEEMREITAKSFQDYGRPIETVTSFKYLGRGMTASKEYLPAVVGILWNSQKIWARLTRILEREGSIPRVSGMFFTAVVQAVLIFGLEMWVMTPRMGQDQGGVTTKGIQPDH